MELITFQSNCCALVNAEFTLIFTYPNITFSKVRYSVSDISVQFVLAYFVVSNIFV